MGRLFFVFIDICFRNTYIQTIAVNNFVAVMLCNAIFDYSKNHKYLYHENK